MRISLKSSGNPESRESQAAEAKHPLWSKELIEKAVKNYLGEMKHEERAGESRSLNEAFDPLITNLHQLRRCVTELWDLKTKSELESKAKDADGRIADFKKRIAKDRIKIAKQLEIWAKATIRLLLDDKWWEGLSESENEFEAMARSIVETSLKETGLESNIRALENSLRESSETELAEGNASAAKKWLDSMIRKHGNTYHWPPELKAKLDSLIKKHGNTYYWSESDGHE